MTVSTASSDTGAKLGSLCLSSREMELTRACFLFRVARFGDGDREGAYAKVARFSRAIARLLAVSVNDISALSALFFNHLHKIAAEGQLALQR